MHILEERSTINYLNFYLRKLEKKANEIRSRGKEIIKVRAEIN